MSSFATSEPVGDVMFRCRKTGDEFDSGFDADQGSVHHIASKTLQLRCRICGDRHSYTFAEAHLRPFDRRPLVCER